MVEDKAVTVADLLPERLELGAAVQEAMDANSEARRPGLNWGLIGGQADKALRGLLNCGVLEQLAPAWLNSDVLREYADPSRHPPGETSVVHLVEHAFTREIRPVLEFAWGASPPIQLRFAVLLSANFRGLALSILDGHLTGGAVGDASVSVQLKCGDVPLTGEKESKEMKLPVSFSFAGEGLRIPARA